MMAATLAAAVLAAIPAATTDEPRASSLRVDGPENARGALTSTRTGIIGCPARLAGARRWKRDARPRALVCTTVRTRGRLAARVIYVAWPGRSTSRTAVTVRPRG